MGQRKPINISVVAALPGPGFLLRAGRARGVMVVMGEKVGSK